MGKGCVESKNKTSSKRKSTMSSLDPSIIQVASFKCRAGVPLMLEIGTDYVYIPVGYGTPYNVECCGPGEDTG